MSSENLPLPELERIPFNKRADDFEYTPYIKELLSLREKALANPLKPGLVFSCDLALSSTKDDVSPDKCPCELELVEPLQTGVDLYGEVWTARAKPKTCSSEALRLRHAIPAMVVAKFVQSSLLRHPHRFNEWEGYRYAQHMVAKEEVAYKRLERHQGYFVPYFYGMQTIDTPSGEPARVLIMEYINGKTFDMVKPECTLGEGESINQVVLERMCRLYKGFRESVLAVHQAGFAHGDLRPANSIIPHDSSQPVLLDFANAIFKCQAEFAHGELEDGCFELLHTCFADYADAITRWEKETS
ncbi:hypothetical protein DFH11DRAFT_1610083 [Phellopilus nigrolimitatus]|nr:hypothetical protein DFH11DRAFT_1610083 [Phellopilus nigrolimitatus]